MTSPKAAEAVAVEAFEAFEFKPSLLLRRIKLFNRGVVKEVKVPPLKVESACANKPVIEQTKINKIKTLVKNFSMINPVFCSNSF
jgi:hypothetical protein